MWAILGVAAAGTAENEAAAARDGSNIDAAVCVETFHFMCYFLINAQNVYNIQCESCMILIMHDFVIWLWPYVWPYGHLFYN